MIKRIIALSTIAMALLALACSDSGNDVTGPGTTRISISDGTATEGEAIRFIVTLSRIDTVDIRFSYSTLNVTAQVGSDYLEAMGTDTIEAGATADTIDVTTLDDAVVENTETFSMGLGSAVGATISDGTGIGSILDNDGGAISVLYSSDVRPILLNRCATAGCHGTGSSSGGFSMGNATYASVRNKIGDHGAIIMAGNAAASNLYLKTTSSPSFGARMPFGQAALSIADQQKIRDWINEGALDN